MVGPTMSSMRRSSSVTRDQGSTVGRRDVPEMKKSGFLAHSFLFGSSREPDEDGADISAPRAIRKQIRRSADNGVPSRPICNLLLHLFCGIISLAPIKNSQL